MPVLNEAQGIAAALRALAPLLDGGAELVIADGDSTDATMALVEAAARTSLCVIRSAPGRAVQMNAGARQARGDVLLFLHADTLLPPNADVLIAQALASGSSVWGRFDVRISGNSKLLPVIAALMNLRSRATGMATGDQAIFMTRAAFDTLGGFAVQPLMEDLEMSRRLLQLSRPACLRARVVTSGRRWDSRGVWQTIWLMWRLRFAYWRVASPERLAERYR